MKLTKFLKNLKRSDEYDVVWRSWIWRMGWIRLGMGRRMDHTEITKHSVEAESRMKFSIKK